MRHLGQPPMNRSQANPRGTMCSHGVGMSFASGCQSVAMGMDCSSIGCQSVAMGAQCRASSNVAFAMGSSKCCVRLGLRRFWSQNATASGELSMVMGSGCCYCFRRICSRNGISVQRKRGLLIRRWEWVHRERGGRYCNGVGLYSVGKIRRLDDDGQSPRGHPCFRKYSHGEGLRVVWGAINRNGRVLYYCSSPMYCNGLKVPRVAERRNCDGGVVQWRRMGFNCDRGGVPCRRVLCCCNGMVLYSRRE